MRRDWFCASAGAVSSTANKAAVNFMARIIILDTRADAEIPARRARRQRGVGPRDRPAAGPTVGQARLAIPWRRSGWDEVLTADRHQCGDGVAARRRLAVVAAREGPHRV